MYNCTLLSEKSLQNLAASKGKLWLKCLTDLPRRHFLDTLWVENFNEIALSHTVKGDRSKFVFCHFWPKFENSKWLPFLRRGKFFENCRVHFLDTLWVENFDEIALSRTVKGDRSKFVFCHFWPKFEIQNTIAAIFEKGKIF